MAVNREQQLVFQSLKPVMSMLLPAGSDEHQLVSSLSALDEVLGKNKELPGFPSRSPEHLNPVMPALKSSVATERSLKTIKHIFHYSSPPSLEIILQIMSSMAELLHMEPSSASTEAIEYVLSSIESLIHAGKKFRWMGTVKDNQACPVIFGLLFNGLIALSQQEQRGKGFGAPNLATQSFKVMKLAVESTSWNSNRVAYYMPGLVSESFTVLCEASSHLPPTAHAACCGLLQEIFSATMNLKSLPEKVLALSRIAGKEARARLHLDEPDTLGSVLAALNDSAISAGSKPSNFDARQKIRKPRW